MVFKRPDLSQAAPEIRTYVEYLENELARLKKSSPSNRTAHAAIEDEVVLPMRPGEPPTTLQLITITAGGIAKRTPRHLYNRQRRGGMGIFDLDAPEDDPPTILVVGEISQSLLLFTNLARAFRIPISQIPEKEVRDRGQSLVVKMDLSPGEHIAAAVPDEARGAVALISERGLVRYLRHHVFGEYMRPGTVMFDPRQFGSLTAVCRTNGDGDLFIASQKGKAIRFTEKLVPPQGGLGLRIDEDDIAIAVTAVTDDSSVFLVDADGNGTIRTMSGFSANKAPGGGGKIAMKTNHLVSAQRVDPEDDVFMISRLSKIIRFMSEEIPAKEGVVQGVNCMSLRADQVMTGIVTH